MNTRALPQLSGQALPGSHIDGAAEVLDSIRQLLTVAVEACSKATAQLAILERDFGMKSPVVLDGLERNGARFLDGTVLAGGIEVRLTPLQSELFALLWKRQGRVVYHAQLRAIWGENVGTQQQVAGIVHQLNRQLSEVGLHVTSARGYGYKLIPSNQNTI